MKKLAVGENLMKLLDNSAQYPTYAVDKLIQELERLHKAKDLAASLGTGTAGVDNMIEKANFELGKRQSGAISEQELIDFSDELDANGRTVDSGPVADKQQDAPGGRGDYFSDNQKIERNY